MNNHSDEPGRDSLDALELVMELEEQLDIDIPDEDAQQIHTVADAVRYIKKLRGERGIN